MNLGKTNNLDYHCFIIDILNKLKNVKGAANVYRLLTTIYVNIRKDTSEGKKNQNLHSTIILIAYSFASRNIQQFEDDLNNFINKL